MASDEAYSQADFLDRVGLFLLIVGVGLVLLALMLDYAYSHVGASPDRPLPAGVPLLSEPPEQGGPVDWAVFQLDASYFAVKAFVLRPVALLFWGAWALLLGWMLRQRRRTMREEMDAEQVARRRRLFRRFWRR